MKNLTNEQKNQTLFITLVPGENSRTCDGAKSRRKIFLRTTGDRESKQKVYAINYTCELPHHSLPDYLWQADRTPSLQYSLSLKLFGDIFRCLSSPKYYSLI
ncbi:hypothetical protein B1H10_07780 [candidate division KSB1 bacterium 4484_188]|nr:MAG: hypothetical protein B1H10_07780 [candidate division KSB1 bacterium 4484_188]